MEHIPPDKNYMIFAKLVTGVVRPVVLGSTPRECFDLLPFAIHDWTAWDIRLLDECWVSRWKGNPNKGRWIIIEEIPCDRKYMRQIVSDRLKAERPNFTIVN